MRGLGANVKGKEEMIDDKKALIPVSPPLSEKL
jgi:hypothetical protein